jgi:hypothetical protein
MTGPQASEGIHQVFFGWSYDRLEHTVVASSFDEDRQRQWRKRLQDHTRLQPVGGSEPPETALSCLEFKDGFVAIVRRVRGGHSSGRNNAHVLIGPATVLGASLALRLERWDGWQDTEPQGPIGTIAPSWLTERAGPAERSLAQVLPLERQLAAVIARLLDYPEAPLSIIGCPDEFRLPMVWALRAAAGNHLAQVSGVQRRWTFSTYQDRHAGSIENLPEIVFLPAVPGTGEPHQRRVVRLDEQLAENGRSATVAGQLVASLLHSAPPPVVPPRPINDAGSRPEHAQGPLPAERRVAPEGARRQVNENVTGKRPAQNARAVLAEPLLGAKTVETFLTELVKLSKSQDRDQLREVFHVDAVNRAAELVEIDTRRDMLGMLLQALYGPGFEDLQDRAVRKHAAQLVKDCQSDQLAMALGAGAVTHAKHEVSEAAFERWHQLGGPLRPVPRRRALIPLSWVKVRRRRFIALAVMAIVLLVGGLVGGYFLGRPASAQSPSGPSTSDTAAPPTSTVPQSTQDPPVPANRSGTAQIAADTRSQQVFAFIEVDDLYYPQGVCAATDGGNVNWRCEHVYTPPGANPELVAIVVQKKQVDDLRPLIGQREGIPWTPGWNGKAQVKP